MKIIESITQSAMRNRQIVLVITGALIIFGIIALTIMPRQEFPVIVIREGVIVGVFPGATSGEVEEQLTEKVEEYLFSYEEVDRNETWSISEEGMMYIFVKIRPEVKDAEMFWATIRHGLNELKSTLPQEVLALIANNDFGDAAAVILTLTSEERTGKELEHYLTILEDEIKQLPSVSKIKRHGIQNEQINIYLDNEKLAFYGINPVTLLATLKMEGSVTYAGKVDNGKVSLPIHLPARYKTENDLAEQIVYTDPRGVSVRLKDIARVVREYEEPDSYVQIDGSPCVVVTLEMMNGNNIVKFGKDIDNIMEKVSKELPPDVKISTIADMPKAVDESVSSFLHEFVIAIIAVIVVTMILLPFRISSIAGLTIPISIMLTMGILYLVGIELNTVSLAALILVLGMVVDNTIVVIDNHVELVDQGKHPWEAAIHSVSELFVPVVSATLAIICVFLPMNYFMTGLAGDFVRPFPATITITLLVSLFVAVLLVPIMTYSWIKTGILKNEHGKKRSSLLDIMQKHYDIAIDWVFNHKAAILIATALIVVLTGVIGSMLTSQFGPKVDRDQFAVEIYLAKGTSLDVTAEAAEDVQQKLLADPRVKHVTAFIGTSSPRFHTLYAPQMPAENYAQIIVNTTSIKATEEILDEYSVTYKSPIPQAHMKWKQLEFSDAPSPIEIRLSGNNISDLKKTSEKVMEAMREVEDITWIRTDYEEPQPSIRLKVNEDEANRLGLTKAMIGYTMAAGMQGIPLGTVWEEDYPISIVLRQEKSRTNDISDIGDIHISSPFGLNTVQARQVVTLVPEWTEGKIIHRNGIRSLTVKGDVKRSTFTYNSFNELKPKLDKLTLPEGVSLSYGGEHKSEITYYTPFLFSLISSIVIIYFILLFQFKTTRLALLIMTTIPLCTFGALIGLLVMNYPFGMTAFIGIIGLVGMVIRNGIIYVDYAEHLRKNMGKSLTEAAIAAGKRRMRPIFLTASAAAVGVIPMIASRSTLWGPVGTVICFGLIFTMFLTLLVLPVMYAIFGPKKDVVFDEGGVE